ncbi:MAG: 4-hydroxythreonine-4-phosphate dehydrogenase PdxA [Brevinematales bacterium]|nr:4-hydroxythreonine-4-phosphate dehydrogenase PdxA [Brevinematales bacterium]
MIGITIGDPLGVGPEVLIKSLLHLSEEEKSNIILIGSINLFRSWAEFYGINLKLVNYAKKSEEGIKVFDVGVDINTIDELSLDISTKISLLSIDASIYLLKNKKIKGVVNSPVSKERISSILPNFKGHTGYYASKFTIKNYNMAFYSNDLRIVLLTEHIPLKDVPKYVSEGKLKTTIQNAYKWILELENRENIKIGICGLNPHAGEGGKIGKEEKIIKNVIELFDFEIIGPLPPDTAFVEYKREKLDCLICMYHDQGLIGFKILHFEDGINVTLGLPFVRSSPDHGTAFNIARKGIANHISMLNAIRYALGVESKSKRQC